MGRQKSNVAALGLAVGRAWLESPGPGLRPLASVIRSDPSAGGVALSRLRGMAVGETIAFDWPDDEDDVPPAWLVCPVCGVSMSESSLQRIGPSCSLCPSCGKVLPF